MRTTLAAALLASAMTLPAFAQEAVTAPQTAVVFTAPTVSVDGYEAYDWNANQADLGDLEGEAVYSSVTNERIGDVNGVYASAGGGSMLIEMSVGGFLGIGDKDIMVPMDQVSIYRGDDWRVYINATEEQLEEYPAYEG
jgi:opacity protein-like surface antigen